MVRNATSMDDTSSSEDEIIKNAVREATDHQFLKDSYFSNEQSEHSNHSKEKDKCNDLKNQNSTKPVSLRKNLEQQDNFNNFGVTPTFQSFVAKKLEAIIEKSIKIKEKQDNDIVNEKSCDNNCGIKLFNSSSEFLVAEDDRFEYSQKRRKVETTVDEKTSLLKCKEVAVEPERILSKVETKSWTSKRKEPEFKYKKLKNGTLVEKT